MRSACLVGCLAAFAASSAAWATSPPRQGTTGVEIWGQPARSLEVADRPLGTTIALFKGSRAAAQLPPATGLMRPLPVVAAHLRGNPGRLLLGKTRRVATLAGEVYLVPTVRGWLCIEGPTFATCHRGLLRQGVTWDFYSTPTGLDVIGIAANNVRAINLAWGTQRVHAQLGQNVFFVHRPISLTSTLHLPPLGRLVVAYRGSRPTAVVRIR
jgi:hypothetical protein